MYSRKLLAVSFAAILAAFLACTACSVNVAKNGEEDKKVDIETPIGGIHVSKDADVRDTGLAVYPGARKKEKKENGEEKSANINISTSKFGLKVVAVEYESEDSPDKVLAYYRDQLKKFGSVLECHTSRHDDMSANVNSKGDSGGNKPVSCKGDNTGPTVELKVGTEDNQHIVAVHPEGKKTSFALVYVKTRGDETI